MWCVLLYMVKQQHFTTQTTHLLVMLLRGGRRLRRGLGDLREEAVSRGAGGGDTAHAGLRAMKRSIPVRTRFASQARRRVFSASQGVKSDKLVFRSADTSVESNRLVPGNDYCIAVH